MNEEDRCDFVSSTPPLRRGGRSVRVLRRRSRKQWDSHYGIQCAFSGFEAEPDPEEDDEDEINKSVEKMYAAASVHRGPPRSPPELSAIFPPIAGERFPRVRSPPQSSSDEEDEGETEVLTGSPVADEMSLSIVPLDAPLPPSPFQMTFSRTLPRLALASSSSAEIQSASLPIGPRDVGKRLIMEHRLVSPSKIPGAYAMIRSPPLMGKRVEMSSVSTDDAVRILCSTAALWAWRVLASTGEDREEEEESINPGAIKRYTGGDSMETVGRYIFPSREEEELPRRRIIKRFTPTYVDQYSGRPRNWHFFRPREETPPPRHEVVDEIVPSEEEEAPDLTLD